jgi:transposase
VPGFVGLAGATAPVEIAWRRAGERWAVPHEVGGVVTLRARWQARPPTLSGGEAPGGLERAATAAWAPAGWPVVVVNPRPAREGARATGQGAQPEAVAARALAHCAAVMRPTPRPWPDAPRQELRALRGRRQPRRGMRTAAPHRLAGPRERRRQASEAPRTGLTASRAPRDDALAARLRASPRWRANAALGQSAPGMGPGCARTLWLALPAWGPLTRQPRAAWGGVAPLKGASGPLRGRRTLWGGRAQGRTGVSLGPLVALRCNPGIKACDERLLAAGKGKTVALTAWRRQFVPRRNGMLKPRTPWQSQEVQG